MNEVEEEERKEVVDKKKSLALKMSSHKEGISESSCDDEDACRRLILSGLPCSFLFLFKVILRIFKYSVFKLCRNYLLS